MPLCNVLLWHIQKGKEQGDLFQQWQDHWADLPGNRQFSYKGELNMNRTVLPMLIVATLVVLIGSAYTVKQDPSQAAFMPAETVNLAFFYKPPQESDPATIVGNFGAVILTHGDENYRKQLVANGFDARIPQYFRFEAIQNPGSCSASTNNNQVAYEAGDFCSISKNHPDWFLLDTAGKGIPTSPGSSYYHMDPGNAEWKNSF
jgi:hypothetical protein